MKRSHFPVLALCIFISTSIHGQDSTLTDPLLKFRKFSEIRIVCGSARVNTNYTVFNYDGNTYNFEKGKYLPSVEYSVNYGWIFRSKENGISTVKTGFNLTHCKADLRDSSGTLFRFGQDFLQIPIIAGFRNKISYNTFKNGLFRAYEVNVGIYASVPVYEKLDNKEDIDSRGESSFLRNLRFGMICQYSLTFLNEKGNGHKLGLQLSVDFEKLVKFRETGFGLAPYYFSTGIFYTLVNRYK